MTYKITGRIHELSEPEAKSEKFTVQTVVLETYGDNDTNRQYPQYVELQAANANCEKLTPFDLGEVVTVSFDIRGRQWMKPNGNEVKYFNTLNLFRVDAGDTTQQVSSAYATSTPAPRRAAPKAPAAPAPAKLTAVPVVEENSDAFVKSLNQADDLPF